MIPQNNMRNFLQVNHLWINIQEVEKIFSIEGRRLYKFVNGEMGKKGQRYPILSDEQAENVYRYLIGIYYDLKKTGKDQTKIRNFFRKYYSTIKLYPIHKKTGIIHSRLYSFVEGSIKKNGIFYNELNPNELQLLLNFLSSVNQSFEIHLHPKTNE